MDEDFFEEVELLSVIVQAALDGDKGAAKWLRDRGVAIDIGATAREIAEKSVRVKRKGKAR